MKINDIKMALLFQECSCWNRLIYHIYHWSGAFGVLTEASRAMRTQYPNLDLQIVYYHIVNENNT